MMKTYTVNVVYSMVHTMYVEADSPSRARALAMDRFSGEPDLSDDEIGDVLHADVVSVLDDEVEKYPVREGEDDGK